MLKIFTILSFSFFFMKSCDLSPAKVMPPVDAPPKSQMLRGLSFVAPPNEFSQDPMPEVKAVNANWIAVIPYGYTRVGEPKVYFNTKRQWWGERVEGAR